MRNLNKEKITLEKWQLEGLLEKVHQLSSLILALSETDYSKLNECEIQAAIVAAFRVSESNYSALNKLLEGEDD